MTLEKLDFIFPFVIFGYGALMTMVWSRPDLIKLGQNQLLGEIWAQIRPKRFLGLLCLVVGGLWSLQNIWL